MTEHEIAARAALQDLVLYHQTHIDRANAALAALGGEIVPMVRPPAPGVIPPPVQMPKVPVREQRPAATGKRRSPPPRIPKYDPSEVTSVAKEAHQAGQSMGLAVAEHFGIKRMNADELISRYRKQGFDIPRSTEVVLTPTLTSVAEAERFSGPFTTEPITRMPIDHQAIRNAAAAAL